MPYAEGMAGAKVLVVGSCMMDLVVRAPRHPRRGETLFGHDFQTGVGGKGLNQAVAARRAGAASVELIGRIGDDPFGAAIKAYLEEAGVGSTHLVIDHETGTGVAVPIVYDDGGNTILSVPRANLAMTAADIHAARPAFEAADILLLQLECALNAVTAAVELARECGLTTILNAAPAAPLPAGVRGLPGVLVVNELEAEALLPGFVGDWAAKAMALLERETGLAVITLGEEGAVAARADGSVVHVPPFPVMAIDSVGAGDAFCGAFAVCLAEGAGVREALRFASAAGALAATKAGAAASLPIRADIARLLSIR